MKKKTNLKDIKAIVNFISEAGMLKLVKRSGWSVLGVQNSESVAEHSFRCAFISFLIAGMEGACAYKAMLMALFNDMQEARITDLHKMAQRYIDSTLPDNKAFYEQISALPKGLQKELALIRKEYTLQKGKEAIIARDADILECLIQAKEYQEFGFKQAYKFTHKAPRFLRTASAKAIWKQVKKSNLNDWWMGLSDFKR